MFKRIKYLFVASVLLLTGCGTSLPKKGLDLWLGNINNYAERLGYKNAIQCNFANYVWITGDGIMKAETLKDTVWYMVAYTMTISTVSETYTTYLMYADGITTELTGAQGINSYESALILVSDGSLKGKIGRL